MSCKQLVLREMIIALDTTSRKGCARYLYCLTTWRRDVTRRSAIENVAPASLDLSLSWKSRITGEHSTGVDVAQQLFSVHSGCLSVPIGLEVIDVRYWNWRRSSSSMGDSFWFIVSQGRKMRFARASAMGLLLPSQKPDLVRYLPCYLIPRL